jgi:hypothetical protein
MPGRLSIPGGRFSCAPRSPGNPPRRTAGHEQGGSAPLRRDHTVNRWRQEMSGKRRARTATRSPQDRDTGAARTSSSTAPHAGRSDRRRCTDRGLRTRRVPRAGSMRGSRSMSSVREELRGLRPPSSLRPDAARLRELSLDLRQSRSCKEQALPAAACQLPSVTVVPIVRRRTRIGSTDEVRYASANWCAVWSASHEVVRQGRARGHEQERQG